MERGKLPMIYLFIYFCRVIFVSFYLIVYMWWYVLAHSSVVSNLVMSDLVLSDSVTLWFVTHQVPLSMGFPRQEYCIFFFRLCVDFYYMFLKKNIRAPWDSLEVCDSNIKDHVSKYFIMDITSWINWNTLYILKCHI